MTSHIGSFAEAVGRQLDITPAQALAASGRYEDLGEWLADHYSGSADVDVYPQGSFRLGTVVQPVSDRGDIDVDLVFVRGIRPESVTQAELKAAAGELLTAYSRERNFAAPIELGRCWRLDFFDDGFHLDVLPAVPDERTAGAIMLSDRDLRHWQFSNPIGYADWFKTRQDVALVAASRAQLAAELSRSVEEIPEFLVRTPLQRVVQVLKRSRDEYFQDDDQAPSSIVITTLVAMAYAGQATTEEALVAVLRDFTSPIENRDGTWWLANPAHDEENFTDKWNTDPERRTKFHRWLTDVQRAVEDGTQASSVDLAMERLAPVFGETTRLGHDALTGSSDRSLDARARGLAPAPNEEFIEDVFPVELADEVSVEMLTENETQTGLVPRQTLRRRRLRQHRKVQFRIVETSVPEPFEVYWKIRNYGRKAAWLGQLRGSIVRGEVLHDEQTRYPGEHYVECYIIKDGVCRARTRYWVPIART